MVTATPIPILLRLPLHRSRDGMELALAAYISELFWSLEKPPLAALPFFVRGRWVNQPINFLSCHFLCSCGSLASHASSVNAWCMQRGDDGLAFAADNVR